MESRYLYKAKRRDTGAWVQGYYAVLCNKAVILQGEGEEQEVIAVQPATLCGCTGFRDENGTLIWENDIVVLPTEDEPLTIGWDKIAARFCIQGESFEASFENYWGYEMEVIGNTFDDWELLGREEE